MKRVDLKELVTADKLEQVVSCEQLGNIVTSSQVRGVHLHFLTQTQRQLWQAVGHEFIEPELLDFIDNIPSGSIFYDIGGK